MTANGLTRLFAVVGQPIEHSLSPKIHNYFMADAHLNCVYLAFLVAPGETSDFVSAARFLKLGGFNVTMPLKREIIDYLDVLDTSVQTYGAVNTVLCRDGQFVGYNTDADGFLLSLKRLGFSVPDRAAVLGGGGAGRTVALALENLGVQVSVVTRKNWRQISSLVKNVPLLVNATPLGMNGVDIADFGDFSFLDSLPPDAVVYDLIYEPRETPLLMQARDRHLRVTNGLPHLVCQAVLSFEIFTGIRPPDTYWDDLMRL